MWYVYMLKCQNGAIYTGVTEDIERRLKVHTLGKGGHYTNYNRPREVLHKEPIKDRLEAEQRERQIKRWSRVKKLALIAGDKSELKNSSKSRD